MKSHFSHKQQIFLFAEWVRHCSFSIKKIKNSWNWIMNCSWDVREMEYFFFLVCRASHSFPFQLYLLPLLRWFPAKNYSIVSLYMYRSADYVSFRLAHYILFVWEKWFYWILIHVSWFLILFKICSVTVSNRFWYRRCISVHEIIWCS